MEYSKEEQEVLEFIGWLNIENNEQIDIKKHIDLVREIRSSLVFKSWLVNRNVEELKKSIKNTFAFVPRYFIKLISNKYEM